jgi:YbgC/YbaW family acyl-CoA thioester hydrolase
MESPQPFVFETRIRFIDTDTSGRIHYTCMFRYFESAETEFMRGLGILYIGSDFTFPRVHAECDYKLPLVHDDIIRIEVCLTQLGRSSARFEFRTFKDGELAANGAVVIVCMDRRTQRAIAIPDNLRAKLTSVLQDARSGEGVSGEGVSGERGSGEGHGGIRSGTS